MVRTQGDLLVIIESLLSKGLITETKSKDGKLTYNAQNILDGLFIRCMDCNHICYSIEDSIQHSEEYGHFRDVNLYKRNQFQAVLRKIMKENNLCDYCEKEAFGSNDMKIVLEHEDKEHSKEEQDF